MLWRNPKSACIKQKSSILEDPGRACPTSKWPPWNGSTGTTTNACTPPATTCHPPNTSKPTTANTPPKLSSRCQPGESPDTPGRFTWDRSTFFPPDSFFDHDTGRTPEHSAQA